MAPCIPGTKHEYDWDHHLLHPTTPLRPMVFLQGDDYEEQEYRILKCLQNMLENAERDHVQDKQEIEEMQEQLCRVSR